MTAADAHPVDPPMKWNAWGDPAAAKPLSPGIRSLLSQALGVEGPEAEQPSADQVRLRPVRTKDDGLRGTWDAWSTCPVDLG